MCLYPKLIQNRKYISNKKNGGNVPPVLDKRVLLVPVGCGNCMECLKQKSREWQVRLSEEIRHDNTAKFITFTYSNNSLIQLEKDIGHNTMNGYDLDNAIATLSTRRFLERWRKKYKKSVKHWFVTELGGNNTERVHLHGLLWTMQDTNTIDNIWNYGNTWIGDYVTEKTINYIVKYINKVDHKHKEYKPKILTSPGIGKGYFERNDYKNNTFNNTDTKEYYKTRSGHKMSLPIYYRNKIYSEEEREKLWLNKLDEEVRWVNGKKISIKEEEDTYFHVLDQARRRNKEFGYGDNSINWDRRRYENERRNLKKLERLRMEYARGKKR